MKATKKLGYATMAAAIGVSVSEAHRAEIAAREAMQQECNNLYEVGVEYTWNPFDGMLA